MKKIAIYFVCVFPVVLTAALAFESCNNPASPAATFNTSKKTTIYIDTVWYTQVGTTDSSSSLYYTSKEKWTAILDTAKADSLANWFAQSQYQIQDMWFPAEGPICLNPWFTYNYIYVSLEGPNSSIDTLGFKPSSGPGPCFRRWKHYKFIR